MVTTFCRFCNSKFKIKQSHFLADGNFCNAKCYGQWMATNRKGSKSPLYKKIKKDCQTCGKEYLTIPSKLANGRGKYCSMSCSKIGMALKQKGKVLSEETRRKLSSKRIGELNPAWKGGVGRYWQRYEGKFNRLTKEKVFKRFGKKCLVCNSITRIHVHHRDDNPLNNNLDNLIPLCCSCHMRLHHGLGVLK